MPHTCSSGAESVTETTVGAEHRVARTARALAEHDVAVPAVAVASEGAGGLRGGPVRVQLAAALELGLEQGVRVVRDFTAKDCCGLLVEETQRDAATESFHLCHPGPSAHVPEGTRACSDPPQKEGGRPRNRK